MSVNTAPQRPTMVEGEVRADSVSFAGKLDQGETLTGTPTAEPQPAGLVCSDPAINLLPLTINGRLVPAGKAVVLTVSGGTPGVEYTVVVTVQTTNGQTLIGGCKVAVEARPGEA